MKTIGVLNTKGGVGKTTFTACLSVTAAKNSRVAIVDLDSQGSLGRWYQHRPSSAMPKPNPELITGVERASEAIERLHMGGVPYDHVFLDGPPGSITVTEDAVEACDLVVIPMRASSLDLAASEDAVGLCLDLNKPYLIVINFAKPARGKQPSLGRGVVPADALTNEARMSLLTQGMSIANQPIFDRVDMINAMTVGLTGPERDKKSAAEFAGLWAEVQKAIRGGKQ